MEKTRDLGRFVARRAVTWNDDVAAQWQTVDGTLCFVDISGFTNLSERLAALGRVGAEELTEVLSRVFGSMLELARLRNGALLKYGGDALLLLFEGDDHAVQAASAAVEMRAVLRTAVEIPTSVGHVALRMSVGVHSGDVHLFRASGTHHELIVAGPSASVVTEMEGTAAAGEIVVSSATRALLPTDSATVAKGEGWLLRWRKARTEPCGDSAGAGAHEATIAANIPTALRSHLSAARSDSEHRLAAVAFLELVGLDDLLSERGPEAVSTALGDLVTSVTTFADEEGVTFLATDVYPNGSKIILVSGVPRTQIDECGRILRVARRIADLDSPFGLKIGLNRGHVFAGEIGTDHRSTFTVMGDTVNLAARLMAAAPPGAIYTTPNVLEESYTEFDAEALEPFTVKGKEEPVRASVVGADLGTRTSRTSELLPFTGREDEFADLLSALDDVQRGQGGVIAITGPTGIGKSRLVDESLAAVGTDVYVVEVRAEPYGAASPYRPFRDQVRSILRIERGTNEEMSNALLKTLGEFASSFLPFAPLIGDVAHVDVPETPETSTIDPQFRQTRVADTVVELFDAWTDEPLVIVAEDVHWADPASLSLLDRLSREAEVRSWLVIATSRQPLDRDDGSEFALGPLGEDITGELVYAAAEATPLRPDQVAAIVARSGGNPLFTQELLNVVRETGDTTSLPTSLDGVVGSQIDALDPLARRVLHYVSVLGRSFRTSIARDLIDSQGIEMDSGTRARLEEFLVDDGLDRLQFRHALVRDVAYEGLSYRRRQDLHIRAGHLIREGSGAEDEAILDVLSLHFSLGGDYPLSWEYSRRAGDRNMDVYANIEAETEFERAIGAARRLESVDDRERQEVWVKLGDVRERSGQFALSLDAYRHATTLTGDDPLAKAGVLLKRARARERSGAYSTALSEATRARHTIEGLADRDGQRLLAQVLGLSALIRQAQQKPREALRLAQLAADVAGEVDDEMALATAWRVIDWAYVRLGEPGRAIFSTKALEVYRSTGALDAEAIVSNNLGGFAFEEGEWGRALDYYSRAQDASIKVGNMVEAANAGANIAEVLLNQGRYDEADGQLREARRVFLASGFSEGVAFIDLLVGRMYGIQGDLDASEEALDSTIRELEALGLAGWSLEAAIHLADAKCRSGSPQKGLDVLATAVSEAPPEYVDSYAVLLARIRGSILNSAGRPEESILVLQEGIEIAAARSDTYEAALLTLTLARVAHERTTHDQRETAREALRSLDVRSAPGVSL